MKARTLFAVFVIAVTLLRAGIVWQTEPAPEEAYYFLCAERPAPAYFDGPAGTATQTLWLGPLWRLSAPIWAGAASLLCFVLIRRLGDDELAAWGAVMLNTLPVFNTSALEVSPALPALTLVLAGTICGWKAFSAEKSAPALWWLFAGACFAAAAWYAYFSVLFAFALAVFTLCSPRHRNASGFLGVILLVVPPLAASAPALAWNAGQDWIPLAGGTFQTLWQWDLRGFLFAGADFFSAFSPLAAAGLFAAWFLAIPSVRNHVKPRLVLLLGLPGIAFLIYFALRGRESSGYFLFAAPVLIYYALSLGWHVPRWRTAILAAMILAAAFSVPQVLTVMRSGDSWKAAAGELRETFLAQSEAGQPGLFLIAEDESGASALGYHLRADLIPPKGHPAVYVRESQDISSQFGLWPGYDDFVETETHADEYFTEQKGENPFVGRSAIYVTKESANDVPQTIKAAFASVTFLKEIPPVRGQSAPLRLYLCENYQTLPL